MEANLKIFLILYLIVFIRFSFEQSCGHDDLQKSVTIKQTDVTGDLSRFLQDSEWQPIRIYLDYTTLEAQRGKVSDELISNLKIIMQLTIDIYQNLVKVRRIASPLIIDKCDSRVTIGDDVSKKGVAADLVIFPYFNLSINEKLEASAAVCNNDLVTGRPIAGFVTFGKNLDMSKKNFLYNRSLVILHEVNHILAFNDELYGRFLNEQGFLRPITETLGTKFVNGKTVSIIKSPKVLETARKHFGCETLDGVELEDQGGPGTASTHWESRLMYGDFMIGQTITENVISEISLALLEDSGWYKVNYYTGGLFKYGKNKGCDFLNSKCIRNFESISENEFPITKGAAIACFPGRTAKGIAITLTYNNPLPKNFQYFNDTNLGGFELADYCPVTQSAGSDGWYDGGSCWNGHSEYEQGLGETIGPNSYCFYSSLTYKHDITMEIYKGKSLAVCHQVSCNYVEKTYTVTIRSVNIKCSTAGGAVKVNEFDGTFFCADFNLICTKSVECGDVFDCVNKKSVDYGLSYNYIPKDSVDIYVLGEEPKQSAGYLLTYSYLFFVFAILILP